MCALINACGVVLDYGPSLYVRLVQKHMGGRIVSLTADQSRDIAIAESIGLWATMAKEVQNG